MTSDGRRIKIRTLDFSVDSRSPQGGVRLGPRSASRSTVIFLAVLLKDTPPNKGRTPEPGDITTTATLPAGGIVMRPLVRSPKRAKVFQRHASRPRQNTLGLCPYHRRLVFEPLEDRRLLTYFSAPTLSAPNNGSTGVSTTPQFSWSTVPAVGGYSPSSYRILVATSTADLSTDPTYVGDANDIINDTPTGTSDISSTALKHGRITIGRFMPEANTTALGRASTVSAPSRPC